MADHYQLVVTTSTEQEAAVLARMAVEARLAACAQVHGPVTSTYRWRGEVETAAEWTCTLKTAADRVAELIERLRAVHGYEVPEIVAMPLSTGEPAYLRWVTAETRP